MTYPAPTPLASLADTQRFADALASTLAPGDVLALDGDLGAGKTHFVQALAKSLGSTATVSSPTFTLIHEYPFPNGKIIHADFYRIQDENELYEIGLPDLMTPPHLCIFEWACKFPSILPPHTRYFRMDILAPDARSIQEYPSCPDSRPF